MTRHPTPRGPRAGFTLIELLVVIAIIGVLMGLTMSAVQNIRQSAKRATAATEMAQITNAVGSFKARMRVYYIPASFNCKSTYAGTEPEAIYLKQVFPYISGCNGASSGVTGLDDGIFWDGNQTLVFFLTGGMKTNYQGFSFNKQKPFMPASIGENRDGPFLESKASKFDSNGRYLDPWGTPYAYFAWDPAQGNNTYGGSHPAIPDGAYKNTSGMFYHAKGFQLICAGKDMTFGPGGIWTPGSGAWGTSGVGGDDLSNFNAGQMSSDNN